MSRNELLALAQRIKDREARWRERGGKVQHVFARETPLVLDAIYKAAGEPREQEQS